MHSSAEKRDSRVGNSYSITSLCQIKCYVRMPSSVLIFLKSLWRDHELLVKCSVIQLLTTEHRRSKKFPHISHRQVRSVITAIEHCPVPRSVMLTNLNTGNFTFLMFKKSLCCILVLHVDFCRGHSSLTFKIEPVIDTDVSISCKKARKIFRQTSSADSCCWQRVYFRMEGHTSWSLKF